MFPLKLLNSYNFYTCFPLKVFNSYNFYTCFPLKERDVHDRFTMVHSENIQLSKNIIFFTCFIYSKYFKGGLFGR